MTEKPTKLIHKYLRHDKKFPHVWCPGCGNGIILGALLRAIDRIGLEKDEIVLASGIGCSGRMPVYVDFNTLHATHGRVLTLATGIKLAKPSLTVITVMGDGDAAAIGGNHFIHAARRNLDLTALIINNQIYGMTGGQHSPTTPYGCRAATAPYGHVESPFSIAELAMVAGAPFVARGTVYHARLLDELVEKAVSKRGFSVVEVMSNCHIQFGRRNKMPDPVTMMKWLKRNAVPVEKARKMKPESLKNTFTVGVLADLKKPVYAKQHEKIRNKAEPARSRWREAGSLPKRTRWVTGTPSRDKGRAMMENDRYEIRFGGSGGQGIILAALVLAEAAGAYEGKHVCQTQSYGPEARGGASRAEVVISPEAIDYPKAAKPRVLLAMNQESCDKFFTDLHPQGLLVVDATLVTHVPTSRAVALPFTKIAREKLDKELAANMVALGAVAHLTGVVALKSLEAALLKKVPEGTKETNKQALRAGVRAAKKVDLSVLPPSLAPEEEEI
jgi:2-oxoglutarate ferredoxin oxidoreductase subunit beta